MRRFFYEPTQETADHILITGSEAHHIQTVLRMRPGETAELFDGVGGVLFGQIERFIQDGAIFRILTRRREQENRSPLILALALLKGKKMDMVVQKATELGIHAFMPFVSRYCEQHGKDSLMLQRWQRIMLEACKQCGRPLPMQISLPRLFLELTFPADSQKIMPWEYETACTFSDLGLQADQPVVLLIGPEGGFHPSEVEQAKVWGFSTVSLGSRILRAETAALAAAALVQHMTGNLAPLQNNLS